jgi:hypothetical protein
MKIVNVVLLLCLIICLGCSSRYVVLWRIEPSGINADTVARYEKEKIPRDKFVYVFGDTIKVIKSELDSLLGDSSLYHWPPIKLRDMSITINSKSKIDDIEFYNISIQRGISFDENKADMFCYSIKYGVIIRMKNAGTYSHTFYTVMGIKGRDIEKYRNINFEELSKHVYNDTALFWR